MMRFILICSFIAVISGEITPTEEYPNVATLDTEGKVKLYWKSNETEIVFELHGKTTGWIGMGISPTGGMAGADIVVGWVEEGNVYISDRYADSNGFPPLDPIQNVELLAGEEKDGWTMIKYRRQLASCEPGYDLPITKDTLKVIYAFGETDPDGLDLTGANYHGSTNRGVKSLILVDSPLDGSTSYPEGEEHSSFELRNDEFEVPAEKTYYNCRLYKLPTFTEKQHVVKVEPIITPGNEMNVHHMLIYQCIKPITDEESLGQNTRCFGSDMPPDFESCYLTFHAWAFGGGTFYYPTHTGFPLGEADSPTYVTIETHYDNPEGKSGIVDSSGLRFTYTSQLRQYDAGLISAGHIVSGLQHLIPPNAESFFDFGDCSGDCLDASMEAGSTDQINVFGTILHSHLLGKRMTVRHIREKTELPYLAEDNAYDFNYQEIRSLSEERVVKKGDGLQVVCDYHTKGVRDGITTGGLDTAKEMCIAFIFYYPKIPVASCQSAPRQNPLLDYFGIESITGNENQFTPTNDINDMEIIAPPSLEGQTVGHYLNAMDWNEQEIEDLSVALRDMPRMQYCTSLQGFVPGSTFYLPALAIDKEYVAKELNCTPSSEDNSTSGPTVQTATQGVITATPSGVITTTQGGIIGTASTTPAVKDTATTTQPSNMEDTTTGRSSNLQISIVTNLLSAILVLLLV